MQFEFAGSGAYTLFSLSRATSVFTVSPWLFFPGKVNHGGTKNAEVAQRTLPRRVSTNGTVIGPQFVTQGHRFVILSAL